MALVLAKAPSHPNYLALFIIQRLCWRQALGFPKENCFYTYKWKKAGPLQCSPLSFMWSWNSIYDFFACLAFLLYLFFIFVSFSILLLFPWQELNDEKHKPSENKYCPGKKKERNPHKWMSGTICSLLWWFFLQGKLIMDKRCRFFENSLDPFYAFRFGLRPPDVFSFPYFLITLLLSYMFDHSSILSSHLSSACLSFFHFPFLSLYPNTFLSEPTPTPPSTLLFASLQWLSAVG